MLNYEQCIFDDLYSIVLEKEMVMLFFVGVCDVRKGCPSTEILQEAGLARETSGLLQVYTLQEAGLARETSGLLQVYTVQEAGLARETCGLLQVYTVQVFPVRQKWEPFAAYMSIYWRFF